VSEGLNMIAAALDWQAGDNAVVCLDLEHPNNVYPWLNQRARSGIEVRAVAPLDGHVDAARIIAAIDARTRLVTLPTATCTCTTPRPTWIGYSRLRARTQKRRDRSPLAGENPHPCAGRGLRSRRDHQIIEVPPSSARRQRRPIA
jgi:hypothetical protein